MGRVSMTTRSVNFSPAFSLPPTTVVASVQTSVVSLPEAFLTTNVLWLSSTLATVPDKAYPCVLALLGESPEREAARATAEKLRAAYVASSPKVL